MSHVDEVYDFGLLVINRNNGPLSYTVIMIINDICRKTQIFHTHCRLFYAPVVRGCYLRMSFILVLVFVQPKRRNAEKKLVYRI